MCTYSVIEVCGVMEVCGVYIQCDRGVWCELLRRQTELLILSSFTIVEQHQWQSEVKHDT